MNPQMPPTDKSAAEARLGAGQVLTLADAKAAGRMDDDAREALRRLNEVANGRVVYGPRMVDQCIGKLQTSDLTININARLFFGQKIETDKYGNCWERSAGSKKRDNTERALFDYSGDDLPSSTSVFPSKKDTSLAKDRLSQISAVRGTKTLTEEGDSGGVHTTLWTNALNSMRPKYAAVNYTGYPHGGAAVAAYGISCFVLKSVVRFNATYTAGDTFLLPSADNLSRHLATYHNMAALIRYADDGILESLIASFQPGYQPALPKNGDQVMYVEAQLHMDIDFGRDVERIVIAQSEIDGCASEKVKKKVMKNLHAFVKRFKIPVQTI